jgi:glycosyltransferase involved in cell wall biosynthesis
LPGRWRFLESRLAVPDPVVSVVIPTFDRVAFLSRAIECVLEQTFADLEVIVVDDGPTDAIAALVDGHGDPRVRLVRHGTNQGVAAARNTGISASRGEYVAFLDDDDLWLPTKLERQIEVFETDSADVVHTLVYVADADGAIYEEPSRAGFSLFRDVAAAGYPYDLLLRRSSFFINTFAVRRECIETIGGFDVSLAAVDDLDFVHRLRRVYDFRLVDEPLAKYCFHSTNHSHDKDPGTWVRLAKKELAWVREANPPGRRRIEAYLEMQIAQSAWIGGAYGRTIRPALLARRLDPSVISGRTLTKYAAASCLPSVATDALRRRSRASRVPTVPYPWIDL